MASSPEKRLQELHIKLPDAPKPMAKYKPAVLVGNILYVSGHGPAKLSDKTPITGRLGDTFNTEQGKECAAPSASTFSARCATPSAHSTR